MNKTTNVNLRLTEEDKEIIRQNCERNGFSNLSEFIRIIAKHGRIKIEFDEVVI